MRLSIGNIEVPGLWRQKKTCSPREANVPLSSCLTGAQARTDSTPETLLRTEKHAGRSRAQQGGKNCRASDAALAGDHRWLPAATRHKLMVPLIIVYLHSGRQLLLRGAGTGGHFLGPSAGLRAPFCWASPSTSPSVLGGSSTASPRRSALRARPRGGECSPASDVGCLPPSTAMRRYVPVVAQRALGPHIDAGSARR